MQITFNPHELLLHQCENIGKAERRQRLPEFFPDAARSAQTEAVVRRDEWAWRNLGDTPFLHPQQNIGVIDRDHESCVNKPAAVNEPGVRIHQAGNSVDHVWCSLKMALKILPEQARPESGCRRRGWPC